MKKIFSKEIFLSPLFLILSFFLFSFNVNADTEYTSTIPAIPIDSSPYVNSTTDNFISLLESNNDCISNNYLNITIFSHNNNLYGMCSLVPLQISINSSHRVYYYINGSNRSIFRYDNGTLTLVSYSTIANYIILSSDFTSQPLDFSSLIYTNYIMSIVNYTLSFTYNGNNFIFDSNNTPTLYSMSSIIPTDNTPILTSFYILIIDKFSVIADFFTDNTYLFALPLIPIFILCIYLIKRSLIK